MKIHTFTPVDTVRCTACGGPEEGKYRDMVGLWIRKDSLVLCNSCAYDLVRILLDRFYPIWGDGPIIDLLEGEA